MTTKKVFQSMDGNQAAAYCAYAFTEVAGIYPITPSTPMPEHVDLWASQGKKNLFGMPVRVIEMQSEAGAAGTVHGSLLSGALTTTFTASQGLLLKIPNMYKIAGELLPGVIHVAARSIAAQSLSIFGDHQDVMAARQTGFAMLASGSVQETMDLAGIAHLAAIKSSIPFMHFFDGFRTSHEVNKIEVLDYSVFDRLLDKEAVKAFRKRAMNSANPITRGTAQNDDVYFQTKEIQEKYYTPIPDIVNEYMIEISKETGRDYRPFSYYGAKDATDVIIAMGSVTEAIREVIDHKVAQGEKVGLLAVHLYRPFSEKYFFDQLPTTVERIAVLDRTKEAGSTGEPLYLDVRSVFYNKPKMPVIVGGRYGLSSKDVTPDQIFAVYDNLKGKQKDHFTIGIVDDVNNSSLPVTDTPDVSDPDTTDLLFFGLGSDGTVGAVKNISKIIGDYTDLYGQAYASYDSKKSGGVTRMHLRFGKNPIRSTYLVNNPHFVSCSQEAYLKKFDLIGGIRQNGLFLLNTTHTAAEMESFLPNNVKRILAKRNVRFYIIDGYKLAKELGEVKLISTIMQSAFFKLATTVMPYEKAQKAMKSAAEKTFARKGEDIVKMNLSAVDRGAEDLVKVQINPEWANLVDDAVVDSSRPDFVRNIADKVNAIKGYDLPVSAFLGYEDGSIPNGTSAYEKRGVAEEVSTWISDNCIQCNQCSYACPHACIRPILATEEEAKNAPVGTVWKNAVGKGLEGLKYRIQVSPLDCTGCGVCINTCPAKTKALEYRPIEEAIANNEHVKADYNYNKVTSKVNLVGKTNLKNTQFAKPLFEFSGACAGCGETPYIKMVTQLFGERMVIANATGCSSIYGASFPASPYTKDANGRGPAWANSLFEDNAEFGFGMQIATETLRDKLQNKIVETKDSFKNAEIKTLMDSWLENRQNGNKTLEIANALIPLLEKENSQAAQQVLELKDLIVKQSQWIIGGDGWAYDIGFGGLDHVIANHEDVNILVLDTEVYSNTGGQSSKSARSGSIAKFTAAGKPSTKKDLAAIAMTYGHVYVATIAHGASGAQVLKALQEAEAYPGPSLVIAYSPCIAHGINDGMGTSHKQAKLAVECGYWPTFRFDPRLALEGKNPLQMDSKEPDWSKYHDFLLSESRYAQLTKINPDHAKRLLDANLAGAKGRYLMYKRYLAMDYSIQAE
ncbi:MAG: pyruvate:ferredoxin (flavodoxin) oxidoreductase [Tenericutes bacterium HGW-Tenericutes-1]|jgi:pyruvate-ferredoxin/flavodoxin oxidoreductase|nr:MAG: pyruvate:ferredoxin (flavodoxin) oxidoreductase [Tenericutes bacterium HGW-Tenericutes-1]